VKPSTITFRKIFGYSLAAVLALYIFVSLYLLFIPGSIFLNEKVTQYYSWFLLPGPYFRDDRIRVVPHLSIAYKTKSGGWSEQRNVEQENFLAYHDGLAYGKLKRSRYERYLAKALHSSVKSTEDIQKKRSFKELHQYLKYYYLPGDADSVFINYQVESLDGRDDSLKTIFQLKYKSF
jgi:hypothetical protein